MGALPNLPPQVIQQMSGMVNSPLAKFALRYWWVTVPIGYTGWAAYQTRKKKGEATVMNVVADMSPIVVVVATLIMLNHTLASAPTTAAPTGASPVGTGPIQDAQFSTTPKPVAGIGGPRA